MDDRAPAGTTGRRGRRRLSVDERRDELIEAALELFSRRAPEEISIDDVAATAGASRALVYHYFGGKQELYLAALRSAAGRLSELLSTTGDGTPLERLAAALDRYFDFVEEHAAGYLAMLRGGPASASGEVSEIVESTRVLLLDRILREFAIASPGPVLRVTLRGWMSLVETSALDWLQHRDLPREELQSLLVEQHILLVRNATRHDPQLREAYDRLVHEEIGVASRTLGAS
ncbi:TetR/AcrR family transcriptional regulator [Actinocorallia populi]|uniref:TetR/AcrR family transcriptional regulator n=1 Tax=Actinocorallia populi TaxID=2079200 RepID=UPI000D09762A|nr:TetR/AcrR family transcriptional regulator [Actinocorallia populi]